MFFYCFLYSLAQKKTNISKCVNTIDYRKDVSIERQSHMKIKIQYNNTSTTSHLAYHFTEDQNKQIFELEIIGWKLLRGVPKFEWYIFEDSNLVDIGDPTRGGKHNLFYISIKQGLKTILPNIK